MQTASLDSLALQLLSHGYHKITYYELSCWRCGVWRIALTESECERSQRCPSCHKSEAGTPIAVGFSRQPCGQWEQVKSPDISPTWRETQAGWYERSKGLGELKRNRRPISVQVAI